MNLRLEVMIWSGIFRPYLTAVIKVCCIQQFLWSSAGWFGYAMSYNSQTPTALRFMSTWWMNLTKKFISWPLISWPYWQSLWQPVIVFRCNAGSKIWKQKLLIDMILLHFTSCLHIEWNWIEGKIWCTLNRKYGKMQLHPMYIATTMKHFFIASFQLFRYGK